MRSFNNPLREDFIKQLPTLIGRELSFLKGGKFCSFNRYNEKELLFFGGKTKIYFNQFDYCIQVNPLVLLDQYHTYSNYTALDFTIEKSYYNSTINRKISRIIEQDIEDNRINIEFHDFLIDTIELYGFDNNVTNNNGETVRIRMNSCLLLRSENKQNILICEYELGNIPSVRIQIDSAIELLGKYKKVGYECVLKFGK